MAINIDTNTDGDVTYQNPPVSRVLFPNITDHATPEEIQAAVDAWLEDHPEATTTVQDGSILPVKLDSSNDAADGYVLSWNNTACKFEWVNVQGDIDDLKQDLEGLDVYTLGLYPQMSVADTAVASFTDGADNIPVKSLTVDVTPVQSGSGDPSPSNVRPISGWTGANVFRSSKNLFDVHDKLTTIGDVYNYYPRFKPNTYYTCSSNCPQGSPANVYFGDGSTDNNGVYNGQTRTAMSDANGYIQFSIRFNPTGTGINMYQALLNGTYWVQVEEGSTATEYEPVTRYNISFPSSAGTVYGGTLDVTNGVLTVDRGYADLGTLTWYKGTGTNGYFYAELSGVKQMTVAGSIPNWVSDCYAVSASRSNADWNTATENNVIGTRQTTPYVCIVDSTYANSDASAFKTGMSGKHLAYELATPVTYQLDPTEVATILGQNNIFADTGDIAELTYRADLKAYIDAHVGS